MTVKLSKLAKDFYKVIAITNAKGTAANYKRYIESFIASVKDKPIENLKPIDLLKWGTTWHKIQAIQRLFSWGVNDAQVLKRNPFKSVKKPRLGERKRTMSRFEIVTLCRASDRCFRDFMIAMRETIARPQEIRGLRWEFLSVARSNQTVLDALPLGEAFIVLDKYKGKERRRDPSKPRIILISKRLGRLLERVARRRKQLKGIVFANSKGQAWTSNAVRCRMRALRKKLALTNDHRGEPIVAYTFRHTQATEAAAKGVRDRVLAELMGHTSTRTTARYQHLEHEHLKEAFDKFMTKPKRQVKPTSESKQ